jgi:transposase
LIAKIPKEDGAVIIMDNARIHSEKECINICGNICEVRFLPPYSPMFNPIENVFGFLKSRIRNVMYNDEFKPKVYAASIAEWGQKVHLRGALVTELLNRGIATITKEEVANSFNHMMKLVLDAINLIDL